MISAVMVIACAAIVAVLAAWLLRRDPGRPADRASRIWRRVVRRLGRRGLRPAAGETPLQFAERAAGELARGSGELRVLAHQYCRLHYGDAGKILLEDFRRRAGRFSPRRIERRARAGVQTSES